MARLLLLSAYDIDSHRRWRKGLTRHLDSYDWTVLTLPPRYFRWRIRGNPISWLLEQDQLLRQPFDLIIATSMVDICTLRGLYPHLAQCALIVYFHENQLAYPQCEAQHPSIDPAMVNIYSAMAADTVVFNSAHNRRSFLAGLDGLIRKLPDHIDRRLQELIQRKSKIISVPLEDELFTEAGLSSSTGGRGTALNKQKPAELLLLWNHRVEYDKGVDQFLALLIGLKKAGVPFRLILLGQRFRTLPKAWQQLNKQFAEHILINQYAENRHSYMDWLSRADIVVSTACHEFQGLAVMEACVKGCIPLVPDRLSYPEFFADTYLYEDLDQAIQWLIERWQAKYAGCSGDLAAPDLSHLSWYSQTPCYRELIDGLLAE